MKNKILKTITWIMAVLFVISASSLDSNTYIPYIICAVAEIWFVLFMVANREVFRWEKR